MNAGTFILWKGQLAPARERIIVRVTSFLKMLGADESWEIAIQKKKSKRSLQQNAYLWGVVYPSILHAGRDQLEGWESDDLHEYLLGEYFGWETLEGFGKKRLRPLKRSSKLSVSEFMAYVDFIQRRMASIGIYVPDPNESMEAA